VIRSYSLEHLAPYKAPTKVIFLDELPRNPAGKVLKKELRAQYGGGAEEAPGKAEKAPSEILTKLQNAHASTRERIIMDFLQEEIRTLTASESAPSVETALLETGMDSLMMVTLAKNLQTQLGSHLDLPATLVFDYPRICDLSGYLLAELDLDNKLEQAPSETEASIEEMSEEEAEEALRKELEG